MMFLNEEDQEATCKAMLGMGSESKKAPIAKLGSAESSDGSFADLYYLFASNY